jgi:hypothetical protein
LDALDKEVSRASTALAMEHALAGAEKLKNETLEERMRGLVAQIEVMHAKWKDEQDARMKRQSALYEKTDELREARLQLIEFKSHVRYVPVQWLKLCPEALLYGKEYCRV